MRVTVLQSPLVWENPDANRNHFLKKLETVNACDLAVLPEMFSTGFSMKPQGIAHEEADLGTYLKPFADLAVKKSMAIAGSLMVRTANNQYYNRMVVMLPSGDIETYDKRHLFAFAGEHEAYSAGKQPLQININGYQVAFFICYDLRFPVWIRNDKTNPYDVAVFTANWPAVRSNAWETLLKARAIENQCYVVGANRVGVDDNGIEYIGLSQLVDPYGELMAFSRNKETILSCNFDMDSLQAFRKKFPVLHDADGFTLL